jgi:Holliday junction resolvase RusA-like endonuclease
MSLNEYRNEHYFKLNKIKKEWSELVQLAILYNQLKAVNAAELTFTFHFPDARKRDLDNYSATIKMILDGLVEHEILTDDSYSFVRKITIQQESKGKRAEGVTVDIKGL